MESQRSHRLFEIGRESGEKYDYFMAGLATTLTAFMAERFSPSSIEWLSAEMLEAAAILILIGAVVAAVRRLAISNHILRVNHSSLEILEKLDTAAEAASLTGGVIRIQGHGTVTVEQAQGLLADFHAQRKQLHDLLKVLAPRASIATRTRDTLLVVGLLLLLTGRVLGALT